MNTQKYKALTIRAVQNAKGDDLYRARAAFKGLSEKQINEEYGESGKTRNEIIAEYEAHESQHDAAIGWIKSI